MNPAAIRVGIGGWTFPPWRGTFYPDKWPIKRELDYASRHVTAIEVNGTFYSAFKPQTFANWRDATPDGFIFALKASRYCVTRKVLGEAGESIARFCAQGIVELGDKLGPVLWQLPDTKRFDADDIAAFLALLPAAQDGVALRHVVQAGHASFADPAFVALCRAAGVAIVFTDSLTRIAMADLTGPLVYVRLENASEKKWKDTCPTLSIVGPTGRSDGRWATRRWTLPAYPRQSQQSTRARRSSLRSTGPNYARQQWRWR